MRIAGLTVVAVSALALVSGAAAGGGNSDNGVAAKSPEAILAATEHSVHGGVKSVHVVGSVVSDEGARIAFDMNLAQGKGAIGRLSERGQVARIVVVNGEIYVNANHAFWRTAGIGAEVERLLKRFGGSWVKGPASGQFAAVARLADIKQLFAGFTPSQVHGKLTKKGISAIDGQKVIVVADTAVGGTVAVATTGKPYPVEVAVTGPHGARILFDRYNQPVSLRAPAKAVDLTGLPGFQG